ncbi:MAG: hypothetical protein AAF492_30050, partial [Verrucomicrobiota bacterium]
LGGKMDVPNKVGLTPNRLYQAYEGRPAALEALLRSKATSDYTLEESRIDVLFAATRSARMDVMRYLLEAGTDPNKIGGSAYRPYRWLAENPHKDAPGMIDLLVKHGATGPREKNPHHLRELWGNVEQLGVAERLFRDGTTILPDPRLFTSWKTEMRSEALIRVFVKNGLRVPDRKTEFDPAYFSSHEDWLQQVVASTPGALTFLIREGYLKPDYRNAKGETLLHMLAKGRPSLGANAYLFHFGRHRIRSISDMIPFLLNECGITIDARDNDGNTALHTASRIPLMIKWQKSEMTLWRKDYDIMLNELIERGAETDTKNNNGFTPAMLIEASRGNDERLASIQPFAKNWPKLPELK